MQRTFFRAIALCFLTIPAAWGSSAHVPTALDRYVAAPDTNYSFRLVNTVPGDGYTTFVLDMTSQAWLTTNEVNQPLWKHWLVIVKPESITTSKGLLFIGGGNNSSAAPSKPDAKLAPIAVATKSVVAELRMVPNQPLVFAGENKPRSEDALIAYTWDKFLRTGDERWPARLPMTKAAVRALDTVTAFCASPEAGQVKVNAFMVAGGSKRGWTTWTTAAVDKRVIAIAPMVIDLLNIEPSFRHHFAAYGFYSPAVRDYENMQIMEWSGTPEYRALMKIEEPYEYRDRLTLPKFIINSTGDQFFLPDSAQFYFGDLSGPKYLRYVPNTDHSLRNSDAPETLLAAYHAVVTGAPLPKFTWSVENDGVLRVKTVDKPREVKLWQATNPEARNFTLHTLGPAWQSSPLAEEKPGLYIAKVNKPPKGWTAHFVELTFPGNGPAPLKLTTEVRVTPNTLPHTYQPPQKGLKGFMSGR